MQLTSTQTQQQTSNPNAVTVAIASDLQSTEVLISAIPPKGPSSGKRAPLDICCVIDVSGSMGSAAPAPGDGPANAQEDTGLSILDIVKHSLRTIISTMKDDDRIALVSFSSSAKVVCGLTKTTEDGKKTVLAKIDTLQPTGSTNLWDGLKAGMQLLDTDAPNPDSLSTLFILTDGMPNVIPPRGHSAMLKLYLESDESRKPFSINTFGFGYDLESALLLEIAQTGNGGYFFIPDSGMVGTIFIHAVANAYNTFAPRTVLNVEIPEGVDVTVRGKLEVKKMSWGIQIEAGDLQYAQTRDFVVTLSKPCPNLVATLSYRPVSAKGDETTEVCAGKSLDAVALGYHQSRLQLVEALLGIKKNDLKTSQKALATLKDTMSQFISNPDAEALLKDVSGEGLLALEAKNYGRWGVHYLPSLANSHQRQQCGNFKDPGLQVYGRDSAVFTEERDALDKAFDSLPPPTPSIPPPPAYTQAMPGPTRSSRRSAVPQSIAAPSSRRVVTSMSAWNNRAGPCFAGHCSVDTPNGTVEVKDLVRGMEVCTISGTRKVAAIVRTAIPSRVAPMSSINGLVITPWHPIVNDGKWVFPEDVSPAVPTQCEAVYSVLLLKDREDDDSDGHSMRIGGVWCVTLGHGVVAKEDVRAHAFLGDYGTVLGNISRLPGFTDARGVVDCVGTMRGGDGQICGFMGRESIEVEDGIVDCSAQAITAV